MLLWQRKRPCLRPLADPSQLRGAVQQTAGWLFPQMRSPLPPWTLSSLSTDSAAVLPLRSIDTSYKEMLCCSLVLWSGVRCQTWLWRTLLLSYLPPGRVRTLPTYLGSELRVSEDEGTKTLLSSTVQVWPSLWGAALLRLPQLRPHLPPSRPLSSMPSLPGPTLPMWQVCCPAALHGGHAHLRRYLWQDACLWQPYLRREMSQRLLSILSADEGEEVQVRGAAEGGPMC